MNKLPLLTSLTVVVALASSGFYARHEALEWKTVTTQNEPEKRHENAFMRVGDHFYLLGGRKKQSVDRYDPKTNTWQPVAQTPSEMHHFQAVEYKGEIYVLGAFMGDFPHETPVPKVYIYNPKTDKWREGGDIPENRRRGAAGAIAYKDKIYLVNGIIDGHYDGHVSWMDEYDPATGKWRQLPDSPRSRDHFQVAIVGDQMLVAGGAARLTKRVTYWT